MNLIKTILTFYIIIIAALVVGVIAGTFITMKISVLYFWNWNIDWVSVRIIVVSVLIVVPVCYAVTGPIILPFLNKKK